VPYRGSAPALTDMIAGQVQVLFDNLPSSIEHVRAGKLRALAVASPQRVATLRDTPTVVESGFPGYEAVLWVGAFVPARTPGPVLARLQRELDAVLRSAEMRDALAEQAFEPAKLAPAAFAARIREDTVRWRKVISESGLNPE
jgi:tripartite-type tricarboxylate transporter receptor subunit TctC